MGKQINLNNTKIAISAGFLTQIPRDLPHVVFSGRSNVGKSTLINKLVRQNKLARTSASPGKTITINFYDTDTAFYLVDLPGYGYAKRSEAEKRKWSGLVEGYFKNHASDIRLVVQLLDLKVGATGDDLLMINFMESSNIPYVIVATKADKLNKTQRELSLQNLKSENPDCALIPFSSLSGEGTDELRAHILNCI
ncbi:MAG: ribosome biogenesis GTP-binding protein YihA/YsxC [Oscillospiraceae bacterium]|nr:ribosome biogenesis GTP-binding protein YihA/YsxC [Oscillospiraceae bacterium]